MRKRFICLALGLVSTWAYGSHACAEDFLRVAGRAVKEPLDSLFVRQKPKTGKDSAIERLAGEIDWLEHHIDTWGTVVAKQPDVWGDARLTKPRVEFEKQMAADLENFEHRINARISQGDAAALQTMLSLGFATDAPDASLATAQSVRGSTFHVKGNDSVDLEPTVYLDQKMRYLHHLQQIRRINEGDDTQVAPGYALYLLRVPTSVLAGKRTQKGYGAEITMTIDPLADPELLPKTFRVLVVNDLVAELGVQVVVKVAEQRVKRAKEHVEELKNQLNSLLEKIGQTNDANKNQYNLHKLDLEMRLNAALGDRRDERQFKNRLYGSSGFGPAIDVHAPSRTISIDKNNDAVTACADEFLNLRGSLGAFDSENVLDVHKFLNRELHAAYDVLVAHADPSDELARPDLWDPEFVVAVARAVLRNDDTMIETARNQFYSKLHYTPRSKVVELLAWHVYVQSALLNEYLVTGMRQTASAKGCMCLGAGEWDVFCGPNPSDTARQTFMEYVRCKWPVHVFALDPVTQDQNVADIFNRRRERQMALAVAFKQGMINGNSFLRLSRTIDQEIETVALNRTAVGFAHGNDTFGWRFYPRVQTPPVPSRGEFLLRELVIGGPSTDADMKDRQLEQGSRECVALVIMPSFVPYARLDTRGNWFYLTNPRQTAVSMTETMELSRAIKGMETSSVECIACSHLYRDGEIDRLLRRVHQLDRRLPLQSTVFQVPYENTLGGVQLFSGGVSALAPELYGYYGEPGAGGGEDASVFLVGNNFSVHGTRVIAGNESVKDENVTVISRRLLMVTIPKEARISKASNPTDDKLYDQEIDIHVATPYGVTGHLAIQAKAKPATPTSPAATENVGWVPANYAVEYVSSVNAGTVDFAVRRIISDTNDVSIKAPGLARFRGRGRLHAVVTIGVVQPDGKVVQHRVDGSFEVDEIPFDVQKQQFYIVGANLKQFDDSLKDAFLKLLTANPKLADEKRGFEVNVTGRLDVGGTSEAIEGKFSAMFRKVP